jgi:hypothetical protein
LEGDPLSAVSLPAREFLPIRFPLPLWVWEGVRCDVSIGCPSGRTLGR